MSKYERLMYQGYFPDTDFTDETVIQSGVLVVKIFL